ncbi:hypothetical protein OG474_40060 [Kribbella sp. NBC_01505]|uniref:hypothetical protein n=1 Tax=Kribbella sp. NBC_01505 TaxID=2903580 RepID=UPI00386E8185
MSRAELAHAVCTWLWHTQRLNCALDAHYIARLERGAVRRTGASYREALRAVLGVPTDAYLGMPPDIYLRRESIPHRGQG